MVNGCGCRWCRRANRALARYRKMMGPTMDRLCAKYHLKRTGQYASDGCEILMRTKDSPSALLVGPAHTQGSDVAAALVRAVGRAAPRVAREAARWASTKRETVSVRFHADGLGGPIVVSFAAGPAQRGRKTALRSLPAQHREAR